MTTTFNTDIQELRAKTDLYRALSKSYREQADAALMNADYLMQAYNASNTKEDYDAYITCSDRAAELETRADALEKAVNALVDAIEALTDFQ